MADGLDLLKKALERYALVIISVILLATGIFFYFFFTLPQREAQLFTDRGTGSAAIQSSVAAKIERIRQADARKQAMPEIPIDQVRGLTGE